MNAKNTKISFVIPAYNCADTVEESVDSIFNDNFEDGDEVIIVNDASIDNTSTVISELKKKHSSLISVNNEINKGCPTSRNIGIKIAKNPLIFNLDSDNILAPGSIKRLKEYLLSLGANIAAFGEYHYFIKNTNKITHKWICKPGIMTLADFLAGHINPGPGGNFLYTKASWRKIGGYWEYGAGLHEAWGFTLKQLANGAKFAVLRDSYYFHRHGLDSLFVRETKKKNESSLMTTKMITNFIDLIYKKDADFILSNEGSKTWFDNPSSWPIRLKSGEIGTTGVLVKLSKKNKLMLKVKKAAKKFIRFVAAYSNYLKDFNAFKSINDRRFVLSRKERKSILYENTAKTAFDAHYIYHPAWAARVLEKTKPALHIDISSTLSFSTIVSAFIPIEFYDYRPVGIVLDNFKSNFADLVSLPFPDGSIKSLSCMHTVEHIGLGRYGDPIDPGADLKAVNELKRVLTKNGNLLFVVPTGKSSLKFNAHRIYSYDMVLEMFSDLKLKEFSLVTDNNKFIDNASKDLADKQNYGCGCFWFTK